MEDFKIIIKWILGLIVLIALIFWFWPNPVNNNIVEFHFESEGTNKKYKVEVDGIENKDNKEFLLETVQTTKDSLNEKKSAESQLSKIDEKIKNTKKEREEVEKSKQESEKKLAEKSQQLDNSSDDKETERLKKEIEDLKNKIDEDSNKLDDFDKFLQRLSRLARIIGFACAATGNAQCAAVAFVIAEGIDSDLQSRGKEGGGGPTKDQAVESTAWDGESSNQDNNTNNFEEVEVPTSIISEEFKSDIQKRKETLANMGGTLGEFRVTIKNNIAYLYKGENLVKTIDYFNKEGISLPLEWNGVATSQDGRYRIRYIHQDGSTKFLQEESTNQWTEFF